MAVRIAASLHGRIDQFAISPTSPISPTFVTSRICLFRKQAEFSLQRLVELIGHRVVGLPEAALQGDLDSHLQTLVRVERGGLNGTAGPLAGHMLQRRQTLGLQGCIGTLPRPTCMPESGSRYLA